MFLNIICIFLENFKIKDEKLRIVLKCCNFYIICRYLGLVYIMLE